MSAFSLSNRMRTRTVLRGKAKDEDKRTDEKFFGLLGGGNPPPWPPIVDNTLILGDICSLTSATLFYRITTISATAEFTANGGWIDILPVTMNTLATQISLLAICWLVAGVATNTVSKAAIRGNTADVLRAVGRTSVDFINARLIIALVVAATEHTKINVNTLTTEVVLSLFCVACWRVVASRTSI